jgi:hypothetical protein
MRLPYGVQHDEQDAQAALAFALRGWRHDTAARDLQHEREEKRRQEDQEEARRVDEERRDQARRADQADQLRELLGLWLVERAALVAGHNAEMRGREIAQMKAILLTLPGYLASCLRMHLKLNWTTIGVQLDPASVARLRDGDAKDVGAKWLIFDRASKLRRSFKTRPEWIEAEIAYDIAGLTGGDQDAVLEALHNDPRSDKSD